jgi:4-diphosphocytidyl-2-C-methyl-D-erythritol kinase
MISFPHCKINLGLNVIAKRSDGFHAIETCFYPVPWTDILEIIISDKLGFTQSGISIPGKTEDNLCLRAYEILKKDFNLKPVKIHLHKMIPTGAGLGGGSSDAAHTLRLLNIIFGLALSVDQLKGYAAQLGSDCAFFIEDKPKIGTGRGEVLSDVSLSLKEKFIILVKPDVHVSTAEAYAGIKPHHADHSVHDLVSKTELEQWRRILKNDFEDSVFTKHPIIQDIKTTMYKRGALYASMSGSGSSVYGIFDKPVNLANEFQNCLYWSGTLN